MIYVHHFALFSRIAWLAAAMIPLLGVVLRTIAVARARESIQAAGRDTLGFVATIGLVTLAALGLAIARVLCAFVALTRGRTNCVVNDVIAIGASSCARRGSLFKRPGCAEVLFQTRNNIGGGSIIKARI